MNIFQIHKDLVQGTYTFISFAIFFQGNERKSVAIKYIRKNIALNYTKAK